MFNEAVTLIVNDLNAYLESIGTGPDEDRAVKGNIARFDEGTGLEEKVVATVVNITEEATFKNSAHFERDGTRTRYRNAPAFLNLFLLFSVTHKDHGAALSRLSQVVTFFQGKNVFTMLNTPVPEQVDLAADIRVTMELFALTFEQVNYLWASLGGKQMPFVLYKVRMVRIQADRTLAKGHVIEEIVGDTIHKPAT